MKTTSLRRTVHYFYYLKKKDYWNAINWRDSHKEKILYRMIKEGWNPDLDFDDLYNWYKQFNWELDCDCMYYNYDDDTYDIFTPLGWIKYKKNDYYNIVGDSFDFYYLDKRYYYTLTADDEISDILWAMDSKGLLHNHIDGYDGYTKSFSVVYNCNVLQLARYIRKLKRIIRKNKLKVTNENLWKNHKVCTIETYESYWRIYY